jgi:tRNA-splicing ligase RtcB
METRRLDAYRLELPRTGTMLTSARLYLHERMTVEREALSQLRDAASVDEGAVVLATPDIHTGFGVPIGSVLAMADLVCPAAVGYDINCGMRLLTTPLGAAGAPVERLAEGIRRRLPLGEGRRNPELILDRRQLLHVLERGAAGLAEVARRERTIGDLLDPEQIERDLPRIEDRGALPGDPGALSDRALERGAAQLGTLGGGNHFVELQRVDEVRDPAAARALGLAEGQLVVMIHTGSRGLGHQVADEQLRLARSVAARCGLPVPNRELACMPADSVEGTVYLRAMAAAANFAFANRQAIAQVVRRAFADELGRPTGLPLLYDVSHNLARVEDHGGRRLHVHRKGATRAFPPSRMPPGELSRLGQPVLIPGSMGTASYVLLGADGAAETLYSVNHGAGRTMSRTAAAGKVRRRDGKVMRPGAISDRRFAESMAGVHLVCEDRRSIKEEAPDAYKDIDLVIDTVVGAGLARVVARLIPLAVLKG